MSKGIEIRILKHNPDALPQKRQSLNVLLGALMSSARVFGPVERV